MYYTIGLDGKNINIQADSLTEAIEDACLLCSTSRTTLNSEFGFKTVQRVSYHYKNGRMVKCISAITYFEDQTVMFHDSSMMRNVGQSYPVDFTVQLGQRDLTPAIKKAREEFQKSGKKVEVFRETFTKQMLFAFVEGLSQLA